MRTFGVLAVILALCFGFIAPVFANEPKDKLLRGTANVLSAALEVPQNIDIEWLGHSAFKIKNKKVNAVSNFTIFIILCQDFLAKITT